MRVLHVLNYGWPFVDGYTVRSRCLVSAQRRELGIDAQVAVSSFPPFARAEDPDLVGPGWGPDQHRVAAVPASWEARLPRRVEDLQRPAVGLAPLSGPAFTRGLLQVIDAVAPDVVHAHHPAFVGRSAHEAARARDLPFVYEVRCFNGDYDLDTRNPYLLARGHWQNKLETRLASQADHVVTIADGLARRLHAAGLPADRVTVVRNAVDTSRFTAQDRSGHDPGVLRIGYATTFEAIEGLDQLVAAAELARRLPDGRTLEVHIAGTGRDHDRIRRLIADRGLADVVRLPGFLPMGSMPDWYGALDLFVVPRRAAAVAADTTPLKPLEALASGLPLLVSDLPAMRELLAGREGVRFVEAAAAPLAAAITEFATDPWSPESAVDLRDRSWQREVHRYGPVYEAAQQARTTRSAAR